MEWLLIIEMILDYWTLGNDSCLLIINYMNWIYEIDYWTLWNDWLLITKLNFIKWLLLLVKHYGMILDYWTLRNSYYSLWNIKEWSLIIEPWEWYLVIDYWTLWNGYCSLWNIKECSLIIESSAIIIGYWLWFGCLW